MGKILALAFCLIGILFRSSCGAAAGEQQAEFPHLLVISQGAKDYGDPVYRQQLARHDVVILGLWRGWGNIRDLVVRLKRINPKLLVGQYTILNESNDDPKNGTIEDVVYKLNRENWWLRKADGSRVQWTSAYGTWDINITEWTKPDFNGQRYPEWLAQRDYRVFFEPVPEFDIWFFDNVMVFPRIAAADWDGDGKDENGKDPRIQEAYRRGQVAHWEKARALAPNMIVMGNADGDLSTKEYRGRLNGDFLEAMMGKAWSPETLQGWDGMMSRYHTVFDNLLPPKLVAFNVAGKIADYRFFRYAYASCLLDDGYFSFSDDDAGRGVVPWFDEYEVRLGKAIDPPQKAPWRNGVYRRLFANGMALVNPTDKPIMLTLGEGWRRLSGRQDPQTNDGQPVTALTIPPRDAVVLIKP